VVTLDLPRLAERRDDIPLLLAHFVQDAAQRYGRAAPHWSAAQMALWQSAQWPGNVLELRNFAERLVLGVVPTNVPMTIAARESPADGAPLAASLPQQVDAFEKARIAAALEQAAGNVAIAADQLGIPRKTMYDKLKKYALAPARKQPDQE
jgi:two-component system C4-dicarboxylate transport response regulator DctD